jgi:hypothetical protein
MGVCKPEVATGDAVNGFAEPLVPVLVGIEIDGGAPEGGGPDGCDGMTPLPPWGARDGGATVPGWTIGAGCGEGIIVPLTGGAGVPVTPVVEGAATAAPGSRVEMGVRTGIATGADTGRRTEIEPPFIGTGPRVVKNAIYFPSSKIRSRTTARIANMMSGDEVTELAVSAVVVV